MRRAFLTKIMVCGLRLLEALHRARALKSSLDDQWVSTRSQSLIQMLGF